MLENKKRGNEGSRETIYGLDSNTSLDSANSKNYALVLIGEQKMEIKDKNILASLENSARTVNEVTPRMFAVGKELFEKGNSFLVFGPKDYDKKTGKVSAELEKEIEAIGPACTRAGFTRKGDNAARSWAYVGIRAPRVIEIDGKRGYAFVVYTKANPEKGAKPIVETPKPKKQRTRKAKETTEKETITAPSAEVVA